MTTDMASKIASALGPVLATIPRDKQPAFIALAERIAASRYRDWAEAASLSADTRAILLACAEREEEIAGLVESVMPDAARIQADVKANHPDLADAYCAMFEGHSLAQQFAMQAQAERIGASTWRSFAADTDDEKREETFLLCAELEEESASALEDLVARGAAD